MNQCFIGDCRATMARLAAEGVQVQTVVTSPPYWGLRNYNIDGQLGLEETPEEYVDNMVDVFNHVWNLLRDDGTLWLNLGDSYYNYRPGKQARQGENSIAGREVAEVDSGKRSRKIIGLKEKDLVGIPWRVAFALQAAGWYLRMDIVWAKPNPMPESVKDRCTRSHEYVFHLSKKPNYYYDAAAISEPAIYAGDDRGARTDNRRGTECNAMNGKTGERRNKRSVWDVSTVPYSGAHFATFPPELIEPCILAGAPPGGIVLDPFFGSGTTGQVAQRLGRQWIGCELNPEYVNLQDKRTAQQALVL